MGDIQFSEYKNRLQFRFGQMSELTSVNSENLFGIWINTAYRELCSRNKLWEVNYKFDFPELKTADTSQDTVDGTQYISVPTGCLYVIGVEDTENDRYLTWKPWSWFMDKRGRADTAQEGQPKFWCRYGAYIYLNPTPDGAYDTAIWYVARTTDMAADDDTTEIGAEWDDVVLEMATYKGLRWLGQWDEAKECKAAVVDLIKGLAGIYEREKLSYNDRIKPSAQTVSSYKEIR